MDCTCVCLKIILFTGSEQLLCYYIIRRMMINQCIEGFEAFQSKTARLSEILLPAQDWWRGKWWMIPLLPLSKSKLTPWVVGTTKSDWNLMSPILEWVFLGNPFPLILKQLPANNTLVSVLNRFKMCISHLDQETGCNGMIIVIHILIKRWWIITQLHQAVGTCSSPEVRREPQELWLI